MATKIILLNFENSVKILILKKLTPEEIFFNFSFIKNVISYGLVLMAQCLFVVKDSAMFIL